MLRLEPILASFERGRRRAAKRLAAIPGHARAAAGDVAIAMRDPTKRRRTILSVAIMAVAVTSVDYLFTGGPDWNPMAREALAVEHVSAPVVERAETVALPQVDEQLTRTVERVELASYDPTVSADDLLGGPDSAPSLFQNASFVEDGGKPGLAPVPTASVRDKHKPDDTAA